MKRRSVGLHVQEPTPREAIAAIVRADEMGVAAAWLTTGGTAPDGITMLSAAAPQTGQIKLGTSIVPTYPRHPLALAQQALVVADLAPGRFVLGVGPSHRQTIENIFGIPFGNALEHLREYLIVLRQALQRGEIDFEGKLYRAHGRVANPPDVPIILSALRPGSYRLAGELANGAMSWITPAPYLHDRAVPAIRQGATRRDDGVQPVLIAHCFAVVSTDAGAVVSSARERLGYYLRAPFYQEMFAAAGHPEARQGTVTDAMIREIVAQGDEATVERGLQRFFDAGADELIVSLLPVGPNIAASRERTVRLLAGIAQRA